MTRSGKHLNAEDVEIWGRVTRTVKAYKGSAVPSVQRGSTPRIGSQKIAPQNIRPRNVGVLPRKYYDAPQIAKDKRVRRGKITIDRKIDLHDLTQDAALARLTRNLYASAERGHHCVLVVTGKGGVNLGGVLRRMLPLWLSSTELRPLISRYAQAHIRHGGTGAWYVFLKQSARPKHPLM